MPEHIKTSRVERDKNYSTWFNRSFQRINSFLNSKALGDVTAMMCFKFWKTVSKVSDTTDTIRFKLDAQDIVCTVDMFCDTLKLQVETPNNPFVEPVIIEIIKSFMNRVGYQGFVNKEYELVFVGVVIPMNQPKKRKQSARESSSPLKSLKITIKQKQVVKREKDVESYVDKFADSIIHDDDFETRIEPGSHKEHPEEVSDDDDEKKEEKKDDEMGSLETMTEKMQTQIPTPPRSPRINLSLDKNIDPELTDTVSPLTAIPSQDKHKQRHIFNRNLKPMVANTIMEDRDAFQVEVPALISNEFNAQAPKIIEELFKQYVQNNVIQEWDAWVEEIIINEDEVISKDETPELIIEFQIDDKHILTIFDRARMEATLNDMLSDQFRNAEEYAYHLEQATNFRENQIVWESR
nr:hypothetical protein [Tanacetum cinerariifolium]